MYHKVIKKYNIKKITENLLILNYLKTLEILHYEFAQYHNHLMNKFI